AGRSLSLRPGDPRDPGLCHPHPGSARWSGGAGRSDLRREARRLTATTTTNVAHLEVYHGVVTRTNIEINDVLVDRAMRLYRLRSKREAVDFALRKLVGERMT